MDVRQIARSVGSLCGRCAVVLESLPRRFGGRRAPARGVRADRAGGPARPGGAVTPTAERIRGRVVEIEIGEVPGLGWVAVGTVSQGLLHETGMRFEAHAGDPAGAEERLRAEIEAAFA